MGFSDLPRDQNGTSTAWSRVLKEYGTARTLVNSAADWGRSDPLKTHRVGLAMREAGFSDTSIRPGPRGITRSSSTGAAGDLILGHGRGRTALGGPCIEGNSVLRGQS